MAIPFLNNINLSDNQLLNAKLQVTSTAPTAAVGQIYFDSTQTPSVIDTAKYYANSIDTWVSLKEYSFPAGTYVTGAVTGTTPKPIITFDLNAVDGAAAVGERYLTKTNRWAEISTIPGTYKFTISDNATPAVSGIVAGNDTVTIAANSDLTSNLTGETSTSKVLTVGLKVDGGVGIANNYILNQGTAVAAADDTIPFNDYTNNGNPALDTDIVKKTTFGTIPVEALTLVKQYIDDSVAGGLIYQGGYNADTNIPDLDGPPSPNNIKQGWTYTVTNDGLFFTEQVRVGDVLIAEIDTPTTLDDWTTVQNNVDLASPTQVGIGNVNEAGVGNKDGLSVLYASGTATVGLNITDLPNLSVAITAADLDSLEIPLYNGDTSSANEKIEISTLLSAASSKISYATTITDTATISHGFASSDVMVQLYDITTGETVYADVDRISTTQVTITFAATPANSVRVLVQKIG
jgi:hypothetical protein